MTDPHGPDARPTAIGLAGRLRALREATHPRVSQTAAGKAIDGAQSKINRIETGTKVPTATEVRTLGKLYGASRDDINQLVTWATALTAGQVKAGPMLRRGGGTAAFQARIAKMEQGSKLVRAFQPGMVLGQLQTPAYAAQVFTGDPDGLRARLARTKALLEEPSRQWQLVQPVGAFLWNLGGPDVMAEQMDHLAKMAALSNVDLRIITELKQVDFTATHGFHIYDDLAVIVGILTGTTIDKDTSAIRGYVAQFERLHAAGATGEQAQRVLHELAARYRSTPPRRNKKED